MSKVSEVVKLRDDMISELKSLARDDQRQWLADQMVILAQSRESPEQLKLAFAQVLWVRQRFHTDYRDGLGKLKPAYEIFARLSSANRLLSFLKKDVAILWGNFCHDNLQFDDAIERYQEALLHENNPDRKALCLLNIARTYLRTKRFYQALEHAEKIPLDKIAKPHLRQTFLLLKARILLILGYQSLASGPIKEVLAIPDLSSDVALEARYLQISALIPDASFGDAKAYYEDFIAWLEANNLGAAANFYRLEWQVFAALIEASDIGSRHKFLQRSSYLARQVDRADLHELARQLVQISSGDKYTKDDFAQLHAALADLRGRGEHLLYRQVLVQSATTLIKNQHYDKAAEMLREIEIYYQVGEALIPPKLSGLLSKHENIVVQTLAALEAQLPITLQTKKQAVGGFLL
ncbi:MAG: hypothetical protein FJ146_07685 [Deltaproteobacteria bacterium]|nr:hypothetical protein [Deltaproteobacteria bacterium]